MAEGKVINFPVKPPQKDLMRPQRAELIHMLTELSDEAIEFVQRHIAYTYYWTDEHDMSALKEDDMARLRLYCAAVSIESPAFIRELDCWRKHVCRMEEMGALPKRAML